MIDNSIVISTPPHVKSKRTTRGIMIDVCIALLPAVIAGCVFFGWQALMIVLMSTFACAATEFVYYFIANKGFSNKCKDAKNVCKKFLRQFDFTSVVTGLILALILPTTEKWYEVLYEVLIGGIFSIALVKMLFGGTGKNVVNPAAAGRVFMFISFSLTTYVAANFGTILESETLATGATNLSTLLHANPSSAIGALDLLFGTGVAGCIGETCKLALIVGYIYLVVRKVIKWWQPLLYIIPSSFLSVCLSAIGSKSFEIGLFLDYVLSGGLMFAAIFMATDYVTSPKGVYGQITYYLCLAVLTSVLRYLTKIEVISYVILLMNLLVPLIDAYIVRKPFGYKKIKKQKEGK